LEIHWVCLQTEVEDASERMLKEFDEDSFHDLTDELKKGITEIRKRVEQSHAYLSIKKNRTAYREEILEKDMILNSASHLAEKGEMAIMKGDGREAITCWTKAIELIGNTKKLKEGLQRARSL
jgi:predicted negative regulator of RcsB-dependent stress response